MNISDKTKEELEAELISLKAELEFRVRERTRELEKTNKQLFYSVEKTIRALAQTVALRDPYTAFHQDKVADLAGAIALKLGLSGEQFKCVYLAGLVHDIGKIHIPSEILSKPTKLTNIEFEIIKTHSQKGYEVLRNIDLPWPADEVIWQHHEKIDGSGYPQGLAGDDICIEARIVSVADVVEAVSSHRPYRAALGIETALKIISEGSGTSFDPQVVEVCQSLFQDENYQFAEQLSSQI